MNHPADDSQLLASILREEADRRTDPGEHPQPEELLEYVEGALPRERMEALRDHLTACPPCATAVVDLEDLAAPAGRPAAGEGRGDLADFATEADWRRLRQHLGSLPEGRSPSTSRDPAAGRGVPVARVQRWLQHAAVAVLCLGLGYLAALYPAPSSPAPQTDVPVVYLDTVTRDGGEEATVAAAPDGVFVLILTPSDEPPAERYRVVIKSEAGEPGAGFDWSTDALTPTELGTLRLALPRNLLPPGRYRVTLLGLAGPSTEPRPAGRYTLRVLP